MNDYDKCNGLVHLDVGVKFEAYLIVFCKLEPFCAFYRWLYA